MDRPELHVDEDWKARVQAEKAQAEKVQSEQAPPPSAGADLESGGAASAGESASSGERASHKPAAEPEFPPASFQLLVSALATQCLLALGQFPRPGESAPQLRLAEARHYIDTLAMLEEKTKGNLAQDEADALEAVLHQLRLLFLEAKQRG